MKHHRITRPEARVLAEEEFIVAWAMDAQSNPPAPSTTVNRSGLDVLQAHAAAAVAGEERLVMVVGPAGAGKTGTLTAAVDDLHRHGRDVFGVAPTAKAARNPRRWPNCSTNGRGQRGHHCPNFSSAPGRRSSWMRRGC